MTKEHEALVVRKDEALRMALEALEVANSCIDGYYIPKGKTQLPEVEVAITAIKEALSSPNGEAQPEKDIPKIGCVNHDCDKCKAQPDPLTLQGTYTGEHIGKEIKHKIGKTFDELIAEATKPPAVPEEIAKYVDALVQGTHEITEVTIRPKKTWVGLTLEERKKIAYNTAEMQVARQIEEKLKEKNTHDK